MFLLNKKYVFFRIKSTLGVEEVRISISRAVRGTEQGQLARNQVPGCGHEGFFHYFKQRLIKELIENVL